MFRTFLISLLIVFLSSCEGSLEPYDRTAYLKGSITFKGGINSWPSKSNIIHAGSNEIDSAFGLVVVAFTKENPESIIAEYLSGQMYFTDSLPLYSEKIDYSLAIPTTPTELKLIALALQTSVGFLDQVAISIYSETLGDTIPKFIFLGASSTVSGIDFLVDFDNLPTQTFK